MEKEREDLKAAFKAGYRIDLPESADTLTKEMVVYYGRSSFNGRVAIPEGVRRIDNGCFFQWPIRVVSLPKSLREIGTDAFAGCQLKELRVEGDGGKISLDAGAFEVNPELRAVTLGNCKLSDSVFWGCPVRRITLTSECVPSKNDNTFGFGGCWNLHSDNFFGTVRDKYGGALGTYILKGRLVRVNYKPEPDKDFPGCAENCIYERCYTLAGFGGNTGKMPVYEWEKVE